MDLTRTTSNGSPISPSLVSDKYRANMSPTMEPTVPLHLEPGQISVYSLAASLLKKPESIAPLIRHTPLAFSHNRLLKDIIIANGNGAKDFGKTIELMEAGGAQFEWRDMERGGRKLSPENFITLLRKGPPLDGIRAADSLARCIHERDELVDYVVPHPISTPVRDRLVRAIDSLNITTSPGVETNNPLLSRIKTAAPEQPAIGQ